MTGNAGAKQPTIQAGLPIGLKTLPRKDFQTLRGIFGLLFGGRESFELPVAFDHALHSFQQSCLHSAIPD